MRPELCSKLDRAFPIFFEHGYVECGDGWYSILYDAIKRLVEIDPDIKATCIKEKFGELSIYVNHFTDPIVDVLDDVEEASRHVCEECGSTKGVKQTSVGWIKTLCRVCREKKFFRRKSGAGILGVISR